ncbi:DinB family protein [Marivita sp. S0852]|uniref:DinB family protein n=1 Tax=Marivita sp. S0852 TaxID=3373893 RepID=UPI0039829AB8
MRVFREYCLTFARYNAGQNTQLRAGFAAEPEAKLRQARRGFFGSVFKTANHLLWGDMLRMSRFDGGRAGPRDGSFGDGLWL